MVVSPCRKNELPRSISLITHCDGIATCQHPWQVIFCHNLWYTYLDYNDHEKNGDYSWQTARYAAIIINQLYWVRLVNWASKEFSSCSDDASGIRSRITASKKKLPSQPTPNSHDILLCVFPRFKQYVSCYFEFLLARCDIRLRCVRRLMIGFSFGSMTLSRNRLSHHCIDSNTSDKDLGFTIFILHYKQLI